MKDIKKTDIIATALFFLWIASIVAFLIGLLIKDTILAILGVVLYYFILAYLIVIGWRGGFDDEPEDT